MSDKQLNQRIGGNPLSLKRHIVIDNIAKVIYIQVMYKFDGSLKQQEWYDLKNGNWHSYVPKEYIMQFKGCITGGYTVMPYFAEAMANEEYMILQIAELGAKFQSSITT